MDLVRYTFAVMTLGFVVVTHMIGFNNVRVLEIFWIPEIILIAYVIFTIIPFESVPRWSKKIKTFFEDKRKNKKVVKLKPGKTKKLSLPAVFDGVLIVLVAALSFLLLYRI